MNAKNEVIEYLIDQQRQQVNNNQCEDLAHEVQSLKNQLRDVSAQIKGLTLTLDSAENEVMCLRSIVDFGPEQSGCRKEDTQECYHNWRFVGGKSPAVCINCGVTKPEECEHEWVMTDVDDFQTCSKCGAIA